MTGVPAIVIAACVGFWISVLMVRVAVRPLLVELRGLRRDLAAAAGVEVSADPSTFVVAGREPVIRRVRS